jgi:hypothetical protein
MEYVALAGRMLYAIFHSGRISGVFMGVEGTTILWAMFAFQLKHYLCDFVLQTETQAREKGFYGNLAGITHAGTHVIGSIPALLILGCDIETIAVLLIGEFLVHYHTDWLKARTDRMRAAAGQDHVFWMLFGLDQLIHQLTYVAMIYFALRAGLN